MYLWKQIGNRNGCLGPGMWRDRGRIGVGGEVTLDAAIEIAAHNRAAAFNVDHPVLGNTGAGVG